MRSVGFNKSDAEKYNSSNITGLVLTGKLTHTTANTAFTGQPLLWDNVNVQMTLKRGGRDFVIFNDAVLPLAADSGFFSGQYEQVTAVGTVAYTILVAAASGVKEVISLSAKIRLHDIINLKGDDLLKIEVNVTGSAAGTGVDTTVSEILWDIEEGIGNALSIPEIKCETIRANESNTPVSLGGNVVSASFINNDKAGVTSANQVLQNLIVQSDKLPRTDTYDELIAKRDNMFVSKAEAAKRNQSFMLFNVPAEKFSGDDVRLGRVNMRLQLIAANVNAGKNWVVYRGFQNDLTTAQVAVERSRDHAKTNANQYV